MSEKVNARNSASKSLCRISSWSKNIEPDTTAALIEAKITLLNDMWKRYNDCHTAVLGVCGKDTIESENAQYLPLEDIYVETLARLTDAINKIEISSTSSSSRSSILNSSATNPPLTIQAPQVSPLPKISLPKFSDGYVEWQAYRDLFGVLVHDNKELKNIEKFHYLRSSLSGEAERIINHIALTDANYDNAWTTLENRYSNTRIVSSLLVHQLLQQQVASETSVDIKHLLDTTNQTLEMLKNLNRPIDQWDDLIVHIISEKLPHQSRQLWEASLADTSDPATWTQLQTFIRTRFRTLEASSGSQQPSTRSTGVSSKSVSVKKHSLHITTPFKCNFCGKPHPMHRCHKYLAATVAVRRQYVRDHHLCYNCLRTNHAANQCESTARCNHCNKLHHTTLHETTSSFGKFSTTTMHNVKSSTNSDDNTQEYSIASLSTPTVSSNIATNIANNVNNNNLFVHQTVLLATANVKATSHTGITTTLRVLIDQGSQISLITEHATQILGLKRQHSNLDIVPVGHGSTISPNGVTTLKLSSNYNNNEIFANLYILPNITTVLPTKKVKIECIFELPSPLADPQWNTPMPIEILLGADTYHKLIQPGIRKLNNNTILEQNTIFGWILSGELHNQASEMNTITTCSHITATDSIDLLLRKFWEIADSAANEPSASVEENFIEQHFKTTHQRLPTGRYQVRLPFRSLLCGKPDNLGDSLSPAISRLHQIERRNHRNPELLQEYIKFMNNYEESSHMVKIPNDQINHHINGIYYLPHHAVFKPTSTSTKVRVVFDGSQKTNSGISINSTLLTGPTLQAKLVDTLHRWRNHQFVICADIKQMYRQIMIHPDDQDYQRIVWRRSQNEPINHYKLCTVTYGTSAAPYLAVRTLRQLAIDEGLRYPLASRATLSDFYVDDLLSGADDIETTIELQRELKHLMKAGCMELLKWASNSDAILSTIPEQERQCKSPLALNMNETISTLGIVYEPVNDTFGFNIEDESAQLDNITKRQLLSNASKLFDPIGWLEPITITPKIMLQKLWLLKLDWDDPIPQSLNREWHTYRKGLNQLSQLKINRWTGITCNRKYQLDGFSDASTLAYAAVVYLRVHNNEDDSSSISLIAARSRVSPIKTVSIPRLELSGAALLAKLMHHIINNVMPEIDMEIFAWCDSEITLKWLKSTPSRWKVFICNRTSEILSKLPTCKFGYIKSSDNPADLATRGIYPAKLRESHLWWQGPPWLKELSHLWPINIPKASIDENDLEERRVVINLTSIAFEWDFLLRFSTLTRLLRVTSYIRRIMNYIKKVPTPIHLTSAELSSSLSSLIMYTQRIHFADIIKNIDAPIYKQSRSILTPLSPFIDSKGILRMGGRLRRSSLSYEQRHPIILPRKAHLSKLIVHHIHHQTLHGEVSLMLNILKANYWIIHARSAVKEIIYKCIICTKLKAKSSAPYMADLPSSRITPSLPFIHTAIDYAGPISTKASHGRGRKQIVKSYISIFVCLSTKAIHLEAVTELSSLAFIAAFNRFISRRGKCSDVYSDCGTNFIGANKLLNEYINISKHAEPSIAKHNINWHFSPPGAPHFNGLAEAGVKAMKRHLIRTVGNVVLTYEELSTVLCQIEACLNSRPICKVTDDPSQLEVLTPGHFLIGRPPLLPAEPNLLDVKTLRTRWHLLQQLLQSYWKKWHLEYLNELQLRVKWTQPKPEPMINDIVIIRDENLPPLKWSMGKIIELHPGDDGVTRVVTLKTQSNIIKRPVVKLCWLPVHH